MQPQIFINTDARTARASLTGIEVAKASCQLLSEWQVRVYFHAPGAQPAEFTEAVDIVLSLKPTDDPEAAVLIYSDEPVYDGELACYHFDFASVDSADLRDLIGKDAEITVTAEVAWTIDNRRRRAKWQTTVVNAYNRPDDGAPDPADSASNAWLSARAVRFDEAQTLTTEQKAQARTNIGVTSGVSDHGALTGLADDDHTQYFNQTRGDARYPLASAMTTALAAKEPLQTLATLAEMQAGTVTDSRRMSPKLVADAIAALSSGGIDLPVAIADGGTGSTTAQAARVALGTETLVPGVAQVVTLTIESGILYEQAGQYIDIYDGLSVCRFWVSYTGSGDAPAVPSGGRLQVVNVSGFEISDAETAFLSAFAAQSAAFTAVGSGTGVITVTNVAEAEALSPAYSSPPLPIALGTSIAGANPYRQLPAIDGSQLTNVSPAFIPPPGLATRGGVIFSQSFTGQFVNGVDGSGDLLYATPPTDTAAQIRDKLVTLTSTNRLPASAIKDLPSGGGSGTKTIAIFTPRDNQPPATAFATLDTRNSVAILHFDDTTDESGVFVSITPEAAVLTSGLIIRIHWTAATATSGACVWEVCLERLTTDIDTDSFDVAARVTTTTNATSGVPNVSEITLTTIDSVTAGDGFRLKVTRDANNVSDTMSGDAELITVEVRTAN